MFIATPAELQLESLRHSVSCIKRLENGLNTKNYAVIYFPLTLLSCTHPERNSLNVYRSEKCFASKEPGIAIGYGLEFESR
jgi:hypothetical protein